MKKILSVLICGLMLISSNSVFASSESSAPVAVKAFTVSGIAPVGISAVSAVNGTISVTMSGIDPRWRTTSPSASMFKVTKSINGGSETLVTASLIGGSFLNNKPIGYARVPMVLPTSTIQNVVYRVSYNGSPAVAAKAFTVLGIAPVSISAVSAVNGTISVTMGGIDPRWRTTSPSASMFKVTKSINGGPETFVVASLIGGSFVNNKLIGYARVPMILPTSTIQNVVYRVSYNGGPAVAAKAFTVTPSRFLPFLKS